MNSIYEYKNNKTSHPALCSLDQEEMQRQAPETAQCWRHHLWAQYTEYLSSVSEKRAIWQSRKVTLILYH